MDTYDFILLAAYVLITIIVGILSRGRQSDSSDYYISKDTLPGVWGNAIVGLSITATFFSGISFIAYPSIAYDYGVMLSIIIVVFVLHYFLIVRFFIPRFTRKSWSAPYEIIEVRFGRHTRKVTSILYIFMRLGWMAALIYAPALALMGAAQLSDAYFWPLVLTIGLSSTVYSVFGGLRGIMVTDALQMLVIFAGCFFTVGYIIFTIPVPLEDSFQMLWDEGRLDLFLSSSDTGGGISTVAMFIGTYFATLGFYLGDQMSLQRYMTSSSLKEMKRAFCMNIFGVVLILFMLVAIGLAVFAWNQATLESVPMGNSDLAFPYYVARHLPSGFAGLLFAALLAATMSSMTSGINALSGAIQMDLLQDRMREWDNKAKLLTARLLSLLIGLVATLSAWLVSHLGQMFDIAQRLLGVFMGPIAICLLLAVLPLKIRSLFIIASLLLGCAAGMVCATSSQIHEMFAWMPVIGSLWTAPVAMLVSFIIACSGCCGKEPIDNC